MSQMSKSLKEGTSSNGSLAMKSGNQLPGTETIFIDKQLEKQDINEPMTFPEIPKSSWNIKQLNSFCKEQENGKILVVDDEQFNCDIIEGFLMVLGMKNSTKRCNKCYNGEQAVDVIQKAVDELDPYRFSLILMDCNMPFLDGYEATKKIRRIWSLMGIKREYQPKIVAVTGHVEEEYVMKAINSGMDKVYSKPLSIKEFGKLLMDMKFIN